MKVAVAVDSYPNIAVSGDSETASKMWMVIFLDMTNDTFRIDFLSPYFSAGFRAEMVFSFGNPSVLNLKMRFTNVTTPDAQLPVVLLYEQFGGI